MSPTLGSVFGDTPRKCDLQFFPRRRTRMTLIGPDSICTPFAEVESTDTSAKAVNPHRYLSLGTFQ